MGKSINLDTIMLQTYNSSKATEISQNQFNNAITQILATTVGTSPDTNWNLKIVPDSSYDQLVPSLH